MTAWSTGGGRGQHDSSTLQVCSIRCLWALTALNTLKYFIAALVRFTIFMAPQWHWTWQWAALAKSNDIKRPKAARSLVNATFFMLPKIAACPEGSERIFIWPGQCNSMIFNPCGAPMCSRYDASNFGNLEHGPQVFVSLKCNTLEKSRVSLDVLMCSPLGTIRNPSTCYWVDLADGNFSEATFDSRGSIFSEVRGIMEKWGKMHDQGCSNLCSRMMSHVCSACAVREASECRTHASRCTKTTLRSSLIIWQHSTFDAILPVGACLPSLVLQWLSRTWLRPLLSGLRLFSNNPENSWASATDQAAHGGRM